MITPRVPLAVHYYKIHDALAIKEPRKLWHLMPLNDAGLPNSEIKILVIMIGKQEFFRF